MSIFEFSDNYNTAFWCSSQDHALIWNPDPPPAWTAWAAWALGRASLGLEHLSAAFSVDALKFFQARDPAWMWPRLRGLALTSHELEPPAELFPGGANAVLLEAAAAAARMP